MERKKLLKLIKERKYSVIVTSVLTMTVAIGGAYGFNKFYNKPVVLEVSRSEVEIESPIKFGESLSSQPIILVNGSNVAEMTVLQRQDFVKSQEKSFVSQSFIANYHDQELSTSLKDLGVKLEQDRDQIIQNLEVLQTETKKSQLEARSRVPFIREYKLIYTYSKQKAEEWVESISNQVNVAMVEPTLTRPGGGFKVTPGRTGIKVLTEQLSENLHHQLDDLGKTTYQVDVEVSYTQPTVSQSLLESVNSRISVATSTFPLSDAQRAQNVRLAAQKVNGTVLLPGQEFSFGAKVEPVTFAGGYKAAAIFIDGERSEGVGGGICQISSTLYWAQLRTGILPTQRRNHSLPVGYVPLGLDATYATGGIDYRFVNTLDYPIYISAYTNGNTLSIEFWSNSSALNGLTYEPRVAQVDHNSQSQTWSTYLRTYNSNGGLVSEKHIHNSTYRHPRP